MFSTCMSRVLETTNKTLMRKIRAKPLDSHEKTMRAVCLANLLISYTVKVAVFKDCLA